MTIKLDIGCGLVKKPGHYGLDSVASGQVDVLVDLEYGLPFRTDSVSAVYSSHTLEHIRNFVPLMEEIYRICRPGAIVEIVVPYYASAGAHMDPTHVRFFTEETFRCCLSKSNESKRHKYGFKCDFDQISVKYTYLPQFWFLPFKRVLGHLLLNVITEITISLKVKK